MKVAVCIKETLKRTVIVEADDYLEAEEIIKNAYDNCDLVLNPDNSSVDTDFEDDTENYIEIFGEEEFEKLPAEFKTEV